MARFPLKEAEVVALAAAVITGPQVSFIDFRFPQRELHKKICNVAESEE